MFGKACWHFALISFIISFCLIIDVCCGLQWKIFSHPDSAGGLSLMLNSLQDSAVVLTLMGSQLGSTLRSEAPATWRAMIQCRLVVEPPSRESSGTPSLPLHLQTMECRPLTKPGNTRNNYTTSRTLMASTTEQTARNEDEFLRSFILTRQWSFKRHLLSSLSSLHFPLHPKFDWKPVFCVVDYCDIKEQWRKMCGTRQRSSSLYSHLRMKCNEWLCSLCHVIVIV